jgi:hypothetical protein
VTSPLDPVVEALRAHAPTSRHAEMMFGLLVDLLGDQAVVTTANDRTLRTLFRLDAVHSNLIVPWPVARLSTHGRIGWVSPTFDTATGEVVPEPERPAGKSYKLRGLGPGEIQLYDGSANIRVVYGDDGSAREPSHNDQTPSRLAEILDALASKRAQPVELIAACIAMFDPGRHGPGRVQMPVPVPGGPERWSIGLAAARRTLYAGTVPPNARFVVADGVSGTAVGVAETLEAATAEFEARVAASPPNPSREHQTAWDDYDDDGNLLKRGKAFRPGMPPPWEEDDPWEAGEPSEPETSSQPGVVDLGGGTLQFTGPNADDPLPEITVATVPRVVIPLAASPTVPPPFGSWERTTGAKGATAHVARLVRPEGFLQIGEGVLWHADPRTLEDVLDEVDARSPETVAAQPPMSPFTRFVRFRARLYRWAEAQAEKPARFEVTGGGGSGPRFDGSDMDGDREAFVVRRHLKIRRGTA